MAQNTSGKQLADLLVSRGYEPEMLDSSGKAAASAEDAEIFSFDFVTSNDTNHGTVVVMLGADNELEVFSGDNVGRGMYSEDKTEWYEFQHQLKNFATKNFMTFGSQIINKLKYSMQGQAALKEGLFESWNGTKNVSYNGGPDSVRLMIKHKRPMGVNEARFRQVESLFVETAEGERYKLPFRNLSGGRAMVEHVRQGGKPYDMRGAHIVNMVEELNVLSRFRRASKGQVFEGETANLVNETNAYYETMSRTLKGLASGRGYSNYFESWNPADITGQDVIIEDIKTLFVQETIDSRIEQALPILARIQQQGNAMKEANIFEAWADRLMEGTWTIPNTPEQQQELIALLSKELPVGADAVNATEQLYSLFGDDVLFDQLAALADANADADAREIVIARLKEFAQQEPSIAEIITALETPAIEAEPEAVQEGEVKRMLWDRAENMQRAEFIASAAEIGMEEADAFEFWNSVNGQDDVYNDSGLTFDDSEFEEPDDSVERMMELSGMTRHSVDGGMDNDILQDGSFNTDGSYNTSDDEANEFDDVEFDDGAAMYDDDVDEGANTYRPSGDDVAGKNPEKMSAGDKLRNFINAVANKVAPDDETLLKDLQNKADGLDEASWINGRKQDDRELVWKQTGMSYEEACKKYGKENCRLGGKNRRGDDTVEVKVPLVAENKPDDKEPKKDDTRHDTGWKKSPEQHKDQFGNVIKDKNMAKHLAKQGMKSHMEEQVTEDTDAYSALSGQYGHSGKLQEFEKIEDDVLGRLKQLSGLIKTM